MEFFQKHSSNDAQDLAIAAGPEEIGPTGAPKSTHNAR